MLAELRIALEPFPCFGSTAERDTSSEPLKQLLQMFVKTISLGSLLLGLKEAAVTKGSTTPESACISLRILAGGETLPRMALPSLRRGVGSPHSAHAKGQVEQGNAQSSALLLTGEARKPALAPSGVDDSK